MSILEIVNTSCKRAVYRSSYAETRTSVLLAELYNTPTTHKK